jgi:NAD(P)-dependent dehydrogenase (short-subunit alcohol dehydrogenase family)
MNTSNSAPVAVVTGGSRGIGRAICLALARQGWNICFSYVSQPSAAEEVLTEIRKLGAQGVSLRADAARREDVTALFKLCDQTFGRLDALVNNAGIVGGQRSIFDVDEAHLQSVFQANVMGCFFAANEAAQRLSTQRGGRGGAIVNMSSAAARHGGLPEEAHYAASKGALDSFTVALAKELAPHGIRVNAVRPGLIQTDIHQAHGGQATVDRLAPSIPLGRVGLPDEVAQAVAFLCSPQSSYMIGTHLDVSGGR